MSEASAPNRLARSIHRMVEASIGRILTDRNVPREEWATVTSLIPLKVLPASATDPVSVTSLIPVLVGDRVWVVFAGRAAVIVSARPGVATLIPAAVDLNTYTEPGQYYQPLTDNAASGSNYPQDLAGYLEVLKATNGMLWQRYSVYGPVFGRPGTVWQRDYYSGTWTPWFVIASDSGWVKCTLNSGFTNPDTGVYCREINRVLYLTGRVTKTSGNFSTSSATAVGSLPSGYYPSHNRYYAVASAAGIPGVVFLDNTGVISVRPGGATASLDLSTMTPAPLDSIS